MRPSRKTRTTLQADRAVKLCHDELRIRDEIGNAIAQARMNLGLTQARVAELAGTKQSVIARWVAPTAHM